MVVVNNKKERKYVMLLTSMSEIVQAKKQCYKVWYSRDNIENNQSCQKQKNWQNRTHAELIQSVSSWSP